MKACELCGLEREDSDTISYYPLPREDGEHTLKKGEYALRAYKVCEFCKKNKGDWG